jgi:hypothetical protein
MRDVGRHTSKEAHFYLWVAAVVLLTGFLIYGYVWDHSVNVAGSKIWRDAFASVGINLRDDGVKITHDEDVWYHDGKSTCVAYGDWDEKCPRHSEFCAGANFKIGTATEQAKAVADAISAGGRHPKCPLLHH